MRSLHISPTKRRGPRLTPHSTKCKFLVYGTDGEFGYRFRDPENRKLIWRSDVVFSEDSILSDRSQPKNGKKVTFDLFEKESKVDMPIIESESAIQQTIEVDPISNPFVKLESTGDLTTDYKSTRRLTRVQLAKVTNGRS